MELSIVELMLLEQDRQTRLRENLPSRFLNKDTLLKDDVNLLGSKR